MPAILWSAFIFWVSLLSGKTVNQFEVNDKLAHLGVYFLLGVLLLFPIKNHSFFKTSIFVISYVFLMGLGIEFLQENYCENRQFDWMDVVANTAGALFSILLFGVWKRIKQQL